MNLTFKTLEHLKSGYRKLRKRQHLNAVKKLAGNKTRRVSKNLFKVHVYDFGCMYDEIKESTKNSSNFKKISKYPAKTD